MIEKNKKIIAESYGSARLRAVTPLVQAICQENEKVGLFLYDLLQREENQDFFEPSHLEKVLSSKIFLTEKTSSQISEVLAKLFGEEDLSQFRQKTGPFDQAEVKEAVEGLSCYGYHIAPRKLSSSICDSLVLNLKDVDFIGAQSLEERKGFSVNQVDSFKDSLYRVKNQDQLLRKQDYIDLSLDQFFLNVAQSYFRSTPIHVQTNFWFTKAQQNPSDRELNANAQLFHRDKEYIRFLKVFVYLNDVDQTNGPHEFIPKSHKSHSSFFGEGQDSFRRFTDKELQQQQYLEKAIQHVGEKGTIIFEDTYGFHRGGVVQSGYRLMFQLEYCNSLFFRYSPPFDPLVIPSDLSGLKKSRVLANYTNKNRRRLLLQQKKQEIVQRAKAKIKNLIKK